MKKYISFFAFAALTAVVFSCQASLSEEDPGIPEEIAPEEELVLQTYTATTGAVTKTAMDSGNTVWATGDEIKVYYTDASSSSVGISDGVGTRTGVFSGMVPGGKTGAYAVYPAANTSSVDIANRKVTVTIPAEQTLDATTGGFTSGNIATSVVDAGNNLKFQNANAFLSVTVSDAVTKVVVASVDGTALASDIEVTYPEDPADPVTYSNSGTEYDSITLLLPGAAGTYYFSVVPGTHAKGLKFTYYTGSYTETGTYYLNKSLTIARNDNWQFGAFEPTKDYFVKASGSGGNGLSWSSALTPTQMWNMITLAAAGDDSDKKAALFDAIDGATFHLGAGDYNFGADAELAVDETSTLNITIMGGYPANGGARDLANNTTTFTGDDDANGTGDHRILSLGGNMNVTFDGITFDNGNVDGNGGAVAIANGQWKFTGCAFSRNGASGNGGAIDLSGGSASIYKSTFNGNNAGVNGGAISVAEGAKVEILKAASNTQFISNVATGKGGALFIDSKNGDLVMEHSTPNNRINNADFKRNHADYGGAVAVCGESGKASRVFFSNCTMGSNSSSDANYATKDGGAIYFEGECFVNVGNSTVRRNYATAKGGAISVAGWGKLQLYRSYFYRNYAKTGGVVYTEGAASKYADFFVDECSFEANYITEHYGCVFNINGINEFSMYNSSAKDSYTTATKSSDKKNLCPSWIAIDGVQAGGYVSLANCSIIGDTWHGTDGALTEGTALIAIWGTQTNYFTNCIIVPESNSSIAAIRGDGDEVINLYYTHYSSIGNTAAPIDSGGNTTGCQASDFGSLTWSSNCWTWNGQIKSITPTMATQGGVYTRINSICSDFVSWSGSDFGKDQRGEDRGDGDWWPGAYQSN